VYWKGTTRDSLRRDRLFALDFLCASMSEDLRPISAAI
jgi:hypothetical protein